MKRYTVMLSIDKTTGYIHLGNGGIANYLPREEALILMHDAEIRYLPTKGDISRYRWYWKLVEEGEDG